MREINSLRFLEIGLRGVLILSLAVTPVFSPAPALAGRLNELNSRHDEVCKKVEEAEKDPTMGSDRSNIPIAANECANSKSAIDLFEASRTKEYIFYSLGVAATALIFTNAFFASGDQACKILSGISGASSFIIDQTAKSKIADRVKALKTTQAMSSLVQAGQVGFAMMGGTEGLKGLIKKGAASGAAAPVNAVAPAAGDAGASAVESTLDLGGEELSGGLMNDGRNLRASPKQNPPPSQAASNVAKEPSKKNWGCAVTAGFAFIDAVLASVDKNAALKANDLFLDTADEKLNAFYTGNSIKNYQADKKINPAVTLGQGVSSSAGAPAKDPCESKTGNGYLGCLNEKFPDPQVSAILANKDILDTTEKFFGRPLGDVVKGFRNGGAGNLSQAVASGLNLGPRGPSVVEQAMKDAEALAKEFAADRIGGSYIARSAKKRESAPEELDFSKMMGNLLNQMGPEQMGKNKEDPAELVFRKLDLLPAEKIEANKDISLFARIGYRYRKKDAALTEGQKR